LPVDFEVLAMNLINATLLLGLLTLGPAWGQPSFLLQTQEVIASVSDKVKPTVVHLETWGKRSGQRVKSLGSGLVVSAEGKIVTNYHVIDKAEQIQVVLDDKSRHEATVLLRDKLTDLAVLQIQVKKPLAFATFADSEQARVGQWVLAVGNPYGLDRTVSFGIISGKGRYIPGANESGLAPLNDFLQTDALIDPGSSGGPLVDLQGRVLGINSSGIGRGIGFTIPSKVVQEVISGRQAHGQLERGWLGLYTQPFTRELARHWGMAQVHGVLISDLASGSPALAAGLRAGDVVTSLDGEPVEAEQDDETQRFAQQVSRVSPGSTVRLGVRRAGQELTLSVVAGQLPNTDGQEVDSNLGFRVAEITPYRQQRYRLTQNRGFVVTDVDSGGMAEESGVETGDVLVEIEGKIPASLSALREAFEANRPSILLRFQKGQYKYYALMRQRKGKDP